MRRFSADYLGETRRGLWADRGALAPLRLDECGDAIDVGCGAGSLTRVLREHCQTIGVDRDPSLLAEVGAPVVRGDAYRLPLVDGAADLVTCQALLINLSDPGAAVDESVRVARVRVAAIEPDNANVTVESTVDAESDLARRSRELYRAGVGTDVTLGAVPDLFTDAGLAAVRTRRHEHERVIEPPYDERDLEHARRMATGEAFDRQRSTLRAGGATSTTVDELRAEWRAVGREIAAAMEDGAYRRREVVPFHVTVGEVRGGDVER